MFVICFSKFRYIETVILRVYSGFVYKICFFTDFKYLLFVLEDVIGLILYKFNKIIFFFFYV